jgi:hypothetical protein
VYQNFDSVVSLVDSNPQYSKQELEQDVAKERYKIATKPK